jgi:putative tryptophan/tyrosine transport system substrate-binding protein
VNRRELLILGAGVAIAWSGSVRAEQNTIPVIGVVHGLSPDPVQNPTLAAFADGLRKLGYFEGVNVRLEIRAANGATENLPTLVAKIIDLKPDVILAGATPLSVLLKKTGTSIPVVFANVGADPVKLGLVQSLAHLMHDAVPEGWRM